MAVWIELNEGILEKGRGIFRRAKDAHDPAPDCSPAGIRADDDWSGCTSKWAVGSMRRRRANGGPCRSARPASRVKGGAAGLLLLALAIAQVPVGVGVMQSAAPIRREPCELVLASWNSAKLQELREVSRILHLRVTTAADHGIARAPQQVRGISTPQGRTVSPMQAHAQNPASVVAVS